MVTEYPHLGQYDKIPINNYNNLKIDNHEKKDFTLEVNKIDYYQTNIVARSSKTMRECKSIKLKNKKIEA